MFVFRSSRFSHAARATLLLLCLSLAPLSPALQQPVEPTVPRPAVPTAELPERQRDLQQRLARLESQMLKLAKLLGESEPAKAQRLREALRVHGEKELIRRLHETVDQLQRGELGEADASQQNLIRDLNEVLKEISDEANAVDEKRAERERVLELRRRVEALRSGQLENLQRTRAALRAAEFADRLSKEAEQLRTALEQEQPAENAQPAAAQSSEASAPANKAERAEESLNKLRQSAREAEQRLREAQADAPDERAGRALDDARQELKDAAAEPRGPEKGQGAQSEKQPDAGESSGSNSASGQQGGAASAPTRPEDAPKEKIERAIRRLNDEARRLRQADKTREIERAERALEGDARSAQDAQESQGKQQSGKAGAQRLQKAREKMQQAADELSEQDAESSEARQTEALDELQETLDELEDALRQTRQDEMEETLGALESKLRALVARADRTRESLVPLAGMSASVLQEREPTRTLISIADEVVGLQNDTRDIRRLLVDEGTTVLLPELLEQVIVDFAGGERALRDKAASPALTRLDAAIAALKEVLDSVAQRREEMREQQDGQQGGGGNRAVQALLPGSTELKLLRSAQARLHAETAEIAGESDPAGTLYAALADRQAKLIELARKMHKQ